MLLFDLSFTAPRSMANPQAAATSFVKNSVLPRDRVAVATLDLEHGFKLLTAFTSDRELVAMAIRNPSGFRSGDPLQLSNEVQVASRDTGGAALADMLETKNGGKLNDGAGPGDSVNPVKTANLRAESEHSETINRDIAHSNTAYLRARVEKQVGYLGELARTLRGVSGHKQIVFLSEGFDSSVIIGRDARASEATKKENDDLTRGNYGMVDTDDRYGSATSQNVLAEMVKFFRGSDVVLQAIDIKGLRVQNTLDTGLTQGSLGAAVTSNAGLSVLSGPTGGSLFQNANDLSVNFEKMLHAQEVVYVLTFRTTMQKAGQFHDLKVKLVKVPGNPAVSARTGYWEASSVSNEERTLTTA